MEEEECMGTNDPMIPSTSYIFFFFRESLCRERAREPAGNDSGTHKREKERKEEKKRNSVLEDAKRRRRQ